MAELFKACRLEIFIWRKIRISPAAKLKCIYIVYPVFVLKWGNNPFSLCSISQFILALKWHCIPATQTPCSTYTALGIPSDVKHSHFVYNIITAAGINLLSFLCWGQAGLGPGLTHYLCHTNSPQIAFMWPFLYFIARTDYLSAGWWFQIYKVCPFWGYAVYSLLVVLLVPVTSCVSPSPFYVRLQSIFTPYLTSHITHKLSHIGSTLGRERGSLPPLWSIARSHGSLQVNQWSHYLASQIKTERWPWIPLGSPN